MRIVNKLKKVIGLFRIQNVVEVSVPVLSVPDLLVGRCALITGGTSGIGLAIAKAFIRAGAYVIITGRSQKRIERTLSDINSPQCEGIVLNNTDVSSFEEILTNLVQQTKREKNMDIDILVNNAGINGVGMPYASISEYENILDTNLKGTFFLSQYFGKYFVKNKIKGNILNIASASSLRPADSAYSITKWGIRGLTLGLAKALGSKGITVNGIAPGPTATPMLINSQNKVPNLYLERLPLGRYILPEEIASMALFLVSELGRSIMGDIIYMTGGAAILTLDDVKYDF